MNEPTQEQIKELWEWYGFKVEAIPHNLYQTTETTFKDIVVVGLHGLYPPIDLNNLFKYAVPKIRERLKDEYLGFSDLMQIWLGDILSNKDPALALFWALYSLIDKTPKYIGKHGRGCGTPY